MRSLRLLKEVSPDAVEAGLNNEESNISLASKKLPHTAALPDNVYFGILFSPCYATLIPALEIPNNGLQFTSIPASITDG